jgi:hypothetical protein
MMSVEMLVVASPSQAISPFLIATMRSAKRAARLRSCKTAITVVPGPCPGSRAVENRSGGCDARWYFKGKIFSNDRNTTKSDGRAAPERIILTDKQEMRRLHSSCENLSEVSLLC